MNKKPDTQQNELSDPDFAIRRQQARIEVNKLDSDTIHDEPERDRFFNMVYDRAKDDAAQIPWADLAPKIQITNWLTANPGGNRRALDIACGLGDNAEAISNAGYKTTAFDLSSTAILWAKRRFGDSQVDYQTSNLFELPQQWLNSFDLVNECYTLQALPPVLLHQSMSAIATLVKPGGRLLVYTRLRPADQVADGPPWPLTQQDALAFKEFGYELVDDERFDTARGDRVIPHQFAQWRKLD
ncbi:MAG: class I SAM-dependent methyltransferase [Hyphomicrobiales bacterium]|nr:class I SAM-dependent methyltransferase [Hyphomicrobiales bacterium]